MKTDVIAIFLVYNVHNISIQLVYANLFTLKSFKTFEIGINMLENNFEIFEQTNPDLFLSDFC
jgi:hypothetical protein